MICDFLVVTPFSRASKCGIVNCDTLQCIQTPDYKFGCCGLTGQAYDSLLLPLCLIKMYQLAHLIVGYTMEGTMHSWQDNVLLVDRFRHNPEFYLHWISFSHLS